VPLPGVFLLMVKVPSFSLPSPTSSCECLHNFYLYLRIWILDGEEITEEEIKGNPAYYVDCEIEEVRKLAWNYLIEQTDEEVEFLEAEGYFRDIEELEMLDEVEEEKKQEKEQERKRDSGIGLGR